MSKTFVDSGITYLKYIPESWKVIRIKNAFDCGKKLINNKWNETSLLSLTTKGIKEKDINDPNGKLPESFETYQKVEKNDIVMCLFDLDISAVFSGISDFNGMISPAYKVLKCKKNMNPRYAGYYFNYIGYDRKFLHYSKNIRFTLSYDEFSSLPILLPSMEEQEKISDFLDKRIKLINETIENNKKEIELLEKYKRNKTDEILKKGFKANIKTKNTNCIQLGNVPLNWEIKRFKNFVDEFSKGNGITRDELVENGNIDCIRYGDIYTKYDTYFKKSLTTTNLEIHSNAKYIYYGDLLFAATGELIEEIGKCISYLGNDKCLCGGDIIIAKHNQNPKFMSYLMNSNYVQEQKSMGKAKLKVVHISAFAIGNIIVAIPSLDEQNEITNYLDNLYNNIKMVKEYRQKIIEKLEEYKKSLIYEAITGKMEV